MKFLKKLDARGVAHHALFVLVVLAVAIGGTGYLVATHAQTPTSPQQIQADYNACNNSGKSASYCDNLQSREATAYYSNKTQTSSVSPASTAALNSGSTAATTIQPSSCGGNSSAMIYGGSSGNTQVGATCGSSSSSSSSSAVNGTSCGSSKIVWNGSCVNATSDNVPILSSAQIAQDYNTCMAAASQLPASQGGSQAASACGITSNCENNAINSNYDAGINCAGGIASNTDVSDVCREQAINPSYAPGTDCSGQVQSAINYYDNSAPHAYNQGGITLPYDKNDPAFKGCTPSYTSGAAYGQPNTAIPVPCAPGLHVEGSAVWYNGSYIGQAGTPIYTQAQYNKLLSQGKAPNGNYTIIGTGNGTIAPPPKSVTNGKVYGGNTSLSGINVTGLTIQGKKDTTVTYNGVSVGPSNKPLYTQAQFNALPAAKQTSLKASGNYAIVANKYAGLANGQTYAVPKGSTGTAHNNGASITDVQYAADLKQCNAAYGANNAAKAYDCVARLEDSQQLAAQSGTPSTLTARQTLNPTSTGHVVSQGQALADLAACSKALGVGAAGVSSCNTHAQDGQNVVANGGKPYKFTFTNKLSGGGKQVVTVSVTGANKGTVNVQTTKNGKTTSKTTKIPKPIQN